MNKEELRTIVDVAKNYFFEVSGEYPEIGIPYVRKQKESILELTGLIGVSGSRRGCIYVSVERKVPIELAKCLLEIEIVEEAMIYDMLGELCNTLCGNICVAYGNNFTISVPIVISGAPDDLVLKDLAQPIYVIPITWKGGKCLIVAGID